MLFERLPKKLKKKLFWGISSLGYLALAYKLIRYNFFYLHGMKDWPNMLAIVSGVIIILFSIFGRRIPSIAAVLAYIGGFVLAMLFNSDGVDPGGARTNNGWIIWTLVYIIILLGGIVIDFVMHKRGMPHATKNN